MDPADTETHMKFSNFKAYFPAILATSTSAIIAATVDSVEGYMMLALMVLLLGMYIFSIGEIQLLDSQVDKLVSMNLNLQAKFEEYAESQKDSEQ